MISKLINQKTERKREKKHLLSDLHSFSQVLDGPTDYHAPGRLQQPTLTLLVYLLNSVTTALERAAEDKSLLLNKVK